MACDSTYRDDDGTLYECAGISCPLGDWLGVETLHKAWAVDVAWTDEEALAGGSDDPSEDANASPVVADTAQGGDR